MRRGGEGNGCQKHGVVQFFFILGGGGSRGRIVENMELYIFGCGGVDGN